MCGHCCVSVCGPGVLLVVAVGVALGVFVGGILLTIAALFMKRSATLARLLSRDVPRTDPGRVSHARHRCSISTNSAVSSLWSPYVTAVSYTHLTPADE